jgi:hypothetical protein
MSTVHGGPGNIVTSGLVLNLDAANPRSYPPPYNGTTWTDLSGNSNNGTLTNGPTYNSTNGGSIVFDGTNDLIVLPQIKPNFFTLSCWFKATGSPSTNDSAGGVLIVSNPQLFGGSVQYSMNYSWASQRIVFVVQSNLSVSVTNNNSVLQNTIYNVVSTYDGSSRRIYLNGILIVNDIWSTNPIYPTTGVIGTQIGAWTYPGFGRYFKGDIYQTLIYNRALSSSEVSQNFNATRARFGV